MEVGADVGVGVEAVLIREVGTTLALGDCDAQPARTSVSSSAAATAVNAIRGTPIVIRRTTPADEFRC